jgi:hypothetical protein
MFLAPAVSDFAYPAGKSVFLEMGDLGLCIMISTQSFYCEVIVSSSK